MRNVSRTLFVIMCFIFLAGCQSLPGESIFKSQPSDNEITAQVNEVFMNNKLLAPLALEVETINGTVLLSGYVKTIRQSDTAQALAGKVPGVKSVQSNIIVRK